MQIEKGSRYLPIDFWECGFRVKTLTVQAEKLDAYRLRHKIFVDELSWVKPQKNNLEIDVFDDKQMVPLGVFDSANRIIAHVRITLPQRSFMMEEEFPELIDTPICKMNTTVEVSRVCTEMASRKTKIITPYGNMDISLLLYKGLYCWCCSNRINDVCMVIENKLLRLLKISGFPCRKLGKIVIMPDGVSAVAAKVSWREFAMLNRKNHPLLLAWFNNRVGERIAA